MPKIDVFQCQYCYRKFNTEAEMLECEKREEDFRAKFQGVKVGDYLKRSDTLCRVSSINLDDTLTIYCDSDELWYLTLTSSDPWDKTICPPDDQKFLKTTKKRVLAKIKEEYSRKLEKLDRCVDVFKEFKEYVH